MTTSTGTPSPRYDRLDAFWHAASSSYLTLALLFFLALTAVAGLIFPQMPSGLDSAAAEGWLGAAILRYRGAGGVLRAVGVFGILDGVWLRVLLGLLAYNLSLRAAAALHRLVASGRAIDAPPSFPPHLAVQRLTLEAPLEAASTVLRGALRGRYHAVVEGSGVDHACFYARRGRLGALGALLLAGGPLLLLGGLLVNSAVGWRSTEIVLTPHGSANLPAPGGLRVLLNDAQGDAAADITLMQGDGRQARLRVAPLRPARWGNLWVVQTAFGTALEARATSRGRDLVLQALASSGPIGAEIHLPFRQTPSEQAFVVAGRSLTLRVVGYSALPERDIREPVFLVEAYRGDSPSPVVTQLVTQEATFSVDDITLQLRRGWHLVLIVAHLPGMVLIGLGVLLAGIGGVLAVSWSFTQTWAHLSATGDGVSLTLRTEAALRAPAEVRRLGRAVADQLAAQAIAAPLSELALLTAPAIDQASAPAAADASAPAVAAGPAATAPMVPPEEMAG